MDIIEFVEKICGVRLLEYQKEFLRMHEKACKEFGGDYKIILGRKGNVYMVAGKEHI